MTTGPAAPGTRDRGVTEARLACSGRQVEQALGPEGLTCLRLLCQNGVGKVWDCIIFWSRQGRAWQIQHFEILGVMQWGGQSASRLKSEQ